MEFYKKKNQVERDERWQSDSMFCLENYPIADREKIQNIMFYLLVVAYCSYKFIIINNKILTISH